MGIIGSNVTDTMFLTHLVRQQIPDAVVFAYGGDIVLTHPRYTRDLYGTLGLSSYFSLTRYGTDTQTWLQFPSAWDAGLYAAMLDVLCTIRGQGKELDDGGVCRDTSRQKARWSATTGRDESAIVWLTAVGRGAMWPVDVWPRGASGDVPTYGNLGAFALLLVTFCVLASVICLAYCSGRFDWKIPVPACRSVSWAGAAHRDGQEVGFAASALFVTLLGAGFYPSYLWRLRWGWSSTWDGTLIALCLAVSTGVLLTAAYVTWKECWLAKGWWPRIESALPLVLGVGALVTMYCLAPARGTLSALLLAQRAVHLSSGLSPVLPWSFLSTGLIVLSYAGLRRRRLAHARAPLTGDEALDRVSGFRSGLPPDLGALVDGVCQAAARTPIATSPIGWLPVCAAGAVGMFTMVILLRRGVVTMEPWLLGSVVVMTYVVLLAGAAYLASSALILWQQLRRLLRALAWGPLGDAFGRLPADLGRTMGLRWSHHPSGASELRYDMDQLRMLRTLAPQSPLEEWHTRRALEIELELAAVATRPTWTCAYQTAAQGTLSRLAGSLLAGFLVPQWLDEPVVPDRYGDAREFAVTPRDPPVADVVTGFRRRPVVLLRLVEEFVAVEIVRFVGYAFAHLKNLMASAIAVALLALLAVSSYPFRPQHGLLSWIALTFGAVMVVTVTLLLQVERNEVVSRIAKRTAGRIDFDAAFLGQVFTYLVLPIAALLVTQFPTLNEPLSGLLGPLGPR